MGKLKFADLFALVIVVIPYVVWFIIKDSLPESVPIHWDIKGEVNGWVDKSELPAMLSIVTGIGVIMYLLLRFIKRIDPKRNAQLNEGTALKIAVGVLVLI